VPAVVARALELEPQVKALAERYRGAQRALSGPGRDFPVALEGLKLKEISYNPRRGLSRAEMSTGPIALIDQNMPWSS